MGERGVWVILFLMVIGGASAMDDPIVVEANEGDFVKIFVWPAEYGPALNIAEGVCDEDGVFSTTFFSLNTQDVKYQVTVYDGEGDKTHGETFEGYGVSYPLKIDCTFVDKCVMSVMAESEVLALDGVEEVAVVETVVEGESESLNVSVEVVENETVEVGIIEASEEGARSWSLDVEEEVSFLFLIGGVLTFIVFMVAWFKFETFRGWLTRLNYLSEEGELARIEAEIKRKDELIERIKENKMRKKRILLAKKKLERESGKLEKMIRKGIKKKSKK